jgi:hypothetical protein
LPNHVQMCLWFWNASRAVQLDMMFSLTMLEATKKDLLEWLSPGSPVDRHQEIREKIAKNSGQWFWDSEKVQKWVSGDSSKLLICEGIRKLAFLISLTWHSSRCREVVFNVPLYGFTFSNDEDQRLLNVFARKILQPDLYVSTSIVIIKKSKPQRMWSRVSSSS